MRIQDMYTFDIRNIAYTFDIMHVHTVSMQDDHPKCWAKDCCTYPSQPLASVPAPHR